MNEITNVIDKATWLVENKKVRLLNITDSSWYFQVETESGRESVCISTKNGFHLKPCTCRNGIFKVGIRQYFCSHQIACLKKLFLLRDQATKEFDRTVIEAVE